MATKTSLKRLNREYMKILKNPPQFIIARPLESNILEWHYVITGPPESPYHNGEYHGVLLFPPEYPYKPPAIKMMTPNGRFKTNYRLCLSMSDYHPDNWSAAWSVSTILTGLLSFMLEDDKTVGSIETTKEEKIKYAKKSKQYNRNDPTFKLVFPDLCDGFGQLKATTTTTPSENVKATNENNVIQNPPIENNNENNGEQIPLVQNENNGEQIPPVQNEDNDDNSSDDSSDDDLEEIEPERDFRMVRIVEPERDNRPKRRRKRRHIVEPGREQSTFELSLSRRGIREFPLDVLRLVNLRRLKLNGNLLTKLSFNISQLSNLRYLNLTANSFKVFPEVLCYMQKLEILDISRNEIERLPENFGNLQNTLEGFNISNNRLQSIPNYIGKMTQLKLFTIENNPIVYPPYDIVHCSSKASRDEWLVRLKDFLNNEAPFEVDDIIDDDPNSDPDLALALKISLQEEKMRQEAINNGLISNNEDYMLARALEMSMDNINNNKNNNNNNDLIPMDVDEDEDEEIAKAIALSLTGANLHQ